MEEVSDNSGAHQPPSICSLFLQRWHLPQPGSFLNAGIADLLPLLSAGVPAQDICF